MSLLQAWHIHMHKLKGAHVVQHQVIDVQAMLIALMACLVPALPRLNKHKPEVHMCTLPAVAIIAMNAVGLLILDISYMALMLTRPWYNGGTGDAYLVRQACPHDTSVTVISCCPWP